MTTSFIPDSDQADLAHRDDLWEGSPAVTVLLDDYFGVAAPEWRVYWAQIETPAAAPPPPPVAGALKAWNGSAWVTGTLKRWNGSAWVATALKRWNGSAWVAA